MNRVEVVLLWTAIFSLAATVALLALVGWVAALAAIDDERMQGAVFAAPFVLGIAVMLALGKAYRSGAC